jgi:hypothetical protein
LEIFFRPLIMLLDFNKVASSGFGITKDMLQNYNKFNTFYR